MDPKEKKEYIDKVRKRGKPIRIRVNISIDGELWKRFLKSCEKEGVSGSSIIEEFVKSFLEEPK